MRYVFNVVFICSLLLLSQRGDGQDAQPQIKIDTSTTTFEKISENNYKLEVNWEPYPGGAHRYRVRYSKTLVEGGDPEASLTDSELAENDSTSIMLKPETRVCFFKVIALDEAGSEIAESGIYRASLTLTEAKISAGKDWVFLQAFKNSFNQMDPLAGWAIVILIIILMFYGGYMAFSINREVRRQNHCQNNELKSKVEEYMQRWCDNRKAKTKLNKLKEEIEAFNNDRFSILRIFEKGLQDQIDHFGEQNGSEDIERDLENSIVYELENLKLGNYSKRAKHISLNRIKMFGETAPMLGLLGTVSGLIVAFYNILETSRTGADYQQLLSDLSSGIYSAIVTTIIGLIIGIILLFVHHGVESNLKRLQNAWHRQFIEITKIID